jgi:hypothetical protein
MQILLPPLMLISAMGFVLSAITHLAAFAGQIDTLETHLPQDVLEIFTSVMTIGIFAVWMPAALIAQRINNGNRLQFSWKKVLAGCPPGCATLPMRSSFTLCQLFLGIAGGMAEQQHGLRVFSGHWMIFYGMAFCIFFSSWNLPSMLKIRHCPAA